MVFTNQAIPFIRIQAAVAVCLASAAVHAQEQLAFVQLPPVFVSAVPSGVLSGGQPYSNTVITSDDIRRSGYTSLRDVLSRLGLVNVSTPLNGGRSAAVDLRGFGENASANVVFVVDGVRLNDNEGVVPRYGSIPVSSIETIEIIRGGSSVAYGSGASGGVVRITTKKGKEGLGGDALLSMGSFGTRELGVNLYGGANGFALTFNGAKEYTDGYRDNSDADRDYGNLALDWRGGAYSAGVSFSAEGTRAGLPGALSRAQFEQNPRRTNNPLDFGEFERETVRAYGEVDHGDWGAGLRISRRKHDAIGSFDFGGFPFVSVSEYEQDQISPFVRFNLDGFGGAHTLKVGIDRQKAALRGFDAGTLESTALFVEDDLSVSERLRVNAGSRYERSEQAKATGATRDYSSVAHQLGASFNLRDDLTLFARAARSFRIPNANENGFAAAGSSAVPFLETQKADEVEFGVGSVIWDGEFTSSYFVMDVDNELFLDPTQTPARNRNLDALRRQGVEARWKGDLTSTTRLNASYQFLDAKFRSGGLSGGRVPLVPRHSVKVALDHDWTQAWSTELVALAQSDQQAAANQPLQIPGFGTADLNIRYRADQYTVVLQLQNLFDKDYYRLQFGPNGIYPETGRAVFLTISTEF
ncbi:MAG TPA: TonB-dependent receptor [Limnobacter sp.]|nr:TonB-dependent receptor [Limnobacter sp.]